MNETLEQRIIRHEGLRLRPYQDTLGKLSIGYGRCLSTHGISDDEALYMLENDIHEVQEQVLQVFPWVQQLDTVRRSVIEEMAFQLGVQGVMKFQKMLSAVQAKDYATASEEMLDSAWFTQTPKRAKELSELMLNGG